jgi:hypothetical protein
MIGKLCFQGYNIQIEGWSQGKFAHGLWGRISPKNRGSRRMMEENHGPHWPNSGKHPDECTDKDADEQAFYSLE